jgi:hypothetical protein
MSCGLGNSIKLRYKTGWFAGLENLSDIVDINMAWENIKENIKVSAKDILGLYELKQYKPWFDEEC